MNFLQRLLARWRAYRDAARGYGAGDGAPLPVPLANPRITAQELIGEADQRGVADAGAYVQDSWSFGGPDDPESDAFDPPYVHVLRHRREVALATVAEYRDLTQVRVEHIRRWRDECERTMESARTMMSAIAVREARLEAETVRRSLAGDGIEETALDPVNANASPNEAEWEGESNVLGWLPRMLLLTILIGAQSSLLYGVVEQFLVGAGSTVPAVTTTLTAAAVLVIGPYVAAMLFRGRQATGAVRRFGVGLVALAVPWCYVIAVVAMIRGRLLVAERATAEPLHLTPVSVAVMLAALLLMTGVLAVMLGVACRHPFQDAYMRTRALRNRLDVLRRTIADRVDPANREGAYGAGGGEAERAIREAYAAAEDAYFAALVRTIGDPTFTEAVQGRRGLRPPAGAEAELAEPEPLPGITDLAVAGADRDGTAA